MTAQVLAHVRNQWMGALALLLVLTGGGAYALAEPLARNSALDKKEKKQTRNIATKQINAAAPGLSVKSAQSATNAETAALGGTGRQQASPAIANCDPESGTFSVCEFVTLSLPAPARVLVTAKAEGFNGGGGSCRLGTTAGPIPDSNAVYNGNGVAGNSDTMALVVVTDVLPAGTHSFGLDCREVFGEVNFFDPRVAAVAISPN